MDSAQNRGAHLFGKTAKKCLPEKMSSLDTQEMFPLDTQEMPSLERQEMSSVEMAPENKFLHEWARHARSRGHPVWILLRIAARIFLAKRHSSG